MGARHCFPCFQAKPRYLSRPDIEVGASWISSADLSGGYGMWCVKVCGTRTGTAAKTHESNCADPETSADLFIAAVNSFISSGAQQIIATPLLLSLKQCCQELICMRRFFRFSVCFESPRKLDRNKLICLGRQTNFLEMEFAR